MAERKSNVSHRDWERRGLKAQLWMAGFSAVGLISASAFSYLGLKISEETKTISSNTYAMERQYKEYAISPKLTFVSDEVNFSISIKNIGSGSAVLDDLSIKFGDKCVSISTHNINSQAAFFNEIMSAFLIGLVNKGAIPDDDYRKISQALSFDWHILPQSEVFIFKVDGLRERVNKNNSEVVGAAFNAVRGQFDGYARYKSISGHSAFVLNDRASATCT